MMKALRGWCSFPLLAKELTEMAAQRRTYALRVFYGLMLAAIFVLQAPTTLLSQGVDPMAGLGIGRDLFNNLCLLQCYGILLFLPALMCGRIAAEKERDSLVLLFLTDLRPWQIVLQKFIGGLVPMLSFLLLALPLSAIAYACGGLSTTQLWDSFSNLILLALQVGAISLMCSAWCRSSAGALVMAYLAMAVMVVGIRLVGSSQAVHHALLNVDYAVTIDLSSWPFEVVQAPLLPPAIRLATISIPAMVIALAFLGLSRWFLVRRAFVPPSNLLLRLFQQLDRFMHWANRLTGGVIVVRETDRLPGDDPIAWRELTRRSLGKVHYLVRVLLVVEVPVVCVCAFVAALSEGSQSLLGVLTWLAVIAGALGILAVSVASANTIVSERVAQTLEVLLTTPLTSKDIVMQKARALRRLTLVAAIPVATVLATKCWLRPEWLDQTPDGRLPYLVCNALAVAIYFPLVSWLGVWIGLRVRTRFKAISATLICLVVWNAVPLLSGDYLAHILALKHDLYILLWLIAPVSILQVNEEGMLSRLLYSTGWPWAAIALNFTLHGLLLLFFREFSLATADRCLRR
ncbi:MAG: hypothetical protein QOE70_4629 [Chthoniobacter sp.]|jgi:ABC-type transport system involved in multi-copper enzyme maturation permease subunit|nr:hypothetical protein [Chthoniobacter sp.]